MEFGSTSATVSAGGTDTSITATSPAESAGPVTVTVTTASGSATENFTYVAAPTVTSILPTTGPTAGGTSVTLTGTNLTGATAVDFGSTPGTIASGGTDTSITATSPPAPPAR